jgi:hypothetical protein
MGSYHGALPHTSCVIRATAGHKPAHSTRNGEIWAHNGLPYSPLRTLKSSRAKDELTLTSCHLRCSSTEARQYASSGRAARTDLQGDLRISRLDPNWAFPPVLKACQQRLTPSTISTLFIVVRRHLGNGHEYADRGCGVTASPEGPATWLNRSNVI